MVYRGKPSAGCEQCRKSKKRCGLEQPNCLRCVKLGKTCSGYRDVTQLQIQDESSAVARKVQRQNIRSQASKSSSSTSDGIDSPAPSDGGASFTTDDVIDLPMHDYHKTADNDSYTGLGKGYGVSLVMNLPMSVRQIPDDVAVTCFYNVFTWGPRHWSILRDVDAQQYQLDTCLQLAIKACGMAALDNTMGIQGGRQYSRSKYIEALGLINSALQDPKRCRTDESLIAVSLLGYYETLTCESRQSMLSWKAHILGASHLIQLRGKSQFKTKTGRMLFREIRGQRYTQCIWDSESPPAFYKEWQKELAAQTDDQLIAPVSDRQMELNASFADLRHKVMNSLMPDFEAMELAADLERRFTQFADNTLAHAEIWRYHDLDVPDSPHVWNGIVHSYVCNPVPTIWNTYRCMRIMLSNTQDLLLHRLDLPNDERKLKQAYHRSVRRGMADDICKTIPVCLGHSAPAFASPSVLMTAYVSVWPLFFAATCALERVGYGAARAKEDVAQQKSFDTSVPLLQARWVLSRLEYISYDVGLHFADGIAATLRGDLKYFDYLFDDEREIQIAWLKEIDAGSRPQWIQEIEQSRRGPHIMLEADDDPVVEPKRPKWLGRSFSIEGWVSTLD